MNNWESDPKSPSPDSDIARIYLPEVDALIRERLLPGKRLDIWHSPLAYLRRGPETANPYYGSGVHQDFGVTPDDYQESLASFASNEVAQVWRNRYEQDDVAGFIMIDFWRTTYMNQPLKFLPLAVCDPNSVDIRDVVSVGYLNLTPSGGPSNQMSLRANDDQRWSFYPDMTRNEVLALKVFQAFKNDKERKVQSCFHCAFVDPDMPAQAELRQSCEYRVSVFCLNS